MVTEIKYDTWHQLYNQEGYAVVSIGDDSYLLDKNGNEIEKVNGGLYYYNGIKVYFKKADAQSEFYNYIGKDIWDIIYKTDTNKILFEGKVTGFTFFNKNIAYFSYVDESLKIGNCGIYSIDRNGKTTSLRDWDSEVQYGKYHYIQSQLSTDEYVFCNLAPRVSIFLYSIIDNEFYDISAAWGNGLDTIKGSYDLEKGSTPSLSDNKRFSGLQYGNSNYALCKINDKLSIKSGDYNYTALTDFIYSSLSITSEKLILAQKGNEWGYLTQDGIEVDFFDDATEFYNGHAIVINNGIGYIIDENLNKVSEEFKTSQAFTVGSDCFIITVDGKQKLLKFNIDSGNIKPENIPVTGVTLNKTSLSLTTGNTETLTTTINPSNATNKNVTWISNNTNVATVSNSGVVTAVNEGTAIITVKTEDGEKTNTCTIIANAPVTPSDPSIPDEPSKPSVPLVPSNPLIPNEPPKTVKLIPPKSDNVASDGSVDIDKISSEVDTALNKTTGNSINIKVNNANLITDKTFENLSKKVKNINKEVTIYADTTNEKGNILARLYLDVEKFSKIGKDIKLGVKIDNESIAKTQNKFEKAFEQKPVVISLEQQDSFGISIELAVKIDLTELNTKNLIFYSYDKTTNTYKKIKNPTYRIDKNGFFHFKTDKAGDIIIVDNPLLKK